MTVYDFIMVYNETFKYVEEKYGPDAVLSLWKAISDRWCIHLRKLIEAKGIDGMMEYWGGSDGSLGREKADYRAYIDDNGTFNIEMNRCPSVGELIERNRGIYNGTYTYCDHCKALYPPIVGKYGFKMEMVIDYGPEGECPGRCKVKISKKEEI